MVFWFNGPQLAARLDVQRAPSGEQDGAGKLNLINLTVGQPLCGPELKTVSHNAMAHITRDLFRRWLVASSPCVTWASHLLTHIKLCALPLR